MKMKRALMVSCAVILLCTCIVAGMSYALFTDTVSVGNHLQAGNLDVTLTRTNLKYSVLNEQGKLVPTTVSAPLDLTTSTAKNVFGIDSSNIYVAPGSYFDADLQIANKGNTAFTYSVGIKMVGQSTEFAKQLQVTVTHPDGRTTTTKMLDELNGISDIFVGEMEVGDSVQNFSVLVEFVNLDNGKNNDAQSQTAVFDLVVTAVQATANS